MKLIILLLLLFTQLVSAEDDDAVMYVKISKGMVVNYGEPSLSRLRYLKVAVDVRVATPEDAELIELHMPALKDALVFLLSAQDETTVRTIDGKEDIRQEALANFQRIIKRETGLPVVQDLLFGAFIVQR